MVFVDKKIARIFATGFCRQNNLHGFLWRVFADKKICKRFCDGIFKNPIINRLTKNFVWFWLRLPNPSHFEVATVMPGRDGIFENPITKPSLGESLITIYPLDFYIRVWSNLPQTYDLWRDFWKSHHDSRPHVMFRSVTGFGRFIPTSDKGPLEEHIFQLCHVLCRHQGLDLGPQPHPKANPIDHVLVGVQAELLLFLTGC